jgi:hypothetical protein
MTPPAPIVMVDAAHPEHIPAGFTHAAVYVNLEFAWPAAQVARFPHHIKVSVESSASWAAHARAIDIEKGAATPAAAPEFVDERVVLGHDDATIYCNRDNLRAVLAQLGHRRPRLWIATLDDRPWTPVGLAAQIKAVERISIDPARIWAIQNGKHAGYDMSLVFGTPDFASR